MQAGEDSVAATVLTYPQNLLPSYLKEAALDILEREWPSALSREERLRKPLHDPNRDPLILVLVERDVVLGYLAVPSTRIHLAGATYKASGLSSVLINADYRGRGYGRRLVTAARDLIADSAADIGVFTCDPPLVPFYVGCGWTLMEHASVIGGTREKPFPAASLNKRTIMGFFSVKARAHRPAFEDAALHLELREGDLW
jgi:GNAT superfamily N-acetyltransferase